MYSKFVSSEIFPAILKERFMQDILLNMNLKNKVFSIGQKVSYRLRNFY